MTDPTLEVYARTARQWEERRPPDLGDAAAFAERIGPGHHPLLDLGCGPGWHLPTLVGPDVDPHVAPIALDATAAFLERVTEHEPSAQRVRADLTRPPFRAGSIGSVWANKSIVHLPRSAAPIALARLHRATRADAPAFFGLFEGDEEWRAHDGDEFAGRRFSRWPEPLLRAVLESTGWRVDHIETRRRDGEWGFLAVNCTRVDTLPATLGADLDVLCVGINPSPTSAQTGVGFAHPGNRFWPAALRSGLLSVDRDVEHALLVDRVGMTDLTKRVTRTAAELSRSELRAGFERLALVVSWLAPKVICVIGLTTWRFVADRHAVAGLQPELLEGRPVYLMPNPSGLNAHATVESLAEHFAEVRRLATSRA